MATFLFTEEWLSYQGLVCMSGIPRITPSQSRLCLLGAGQVALSATSSTAAFLAAECTSPDYARKPLGLLCTGVVSDQLQIEGADAVVGQPCAFVGATAPLLDSVVYFVSSTGSSGFKVSLAQGGASTSIPSIATGMRALLAPARHGSVMSHSLVYENFGAVTAPLVFRGLFVLHFVGGSPLVHGFAIFDQDVTLVEDTFAPVEVVPTF